MTISTESLLEGLNSVISIPLIPFTDGEIDYDGHAKNIDYLMNNNNLIVHVLFQSQAQV